jgi:valyl-tRNA synthetase
MSRAGSGAGHPLQADPGQQAGAGRTGPQLRQQIWNAARFALLNLEGYTPPQHDPAPTELVDRWILSRLSATRQP